MDSLSVFIKSIDTAPAIIACPSPPDDAVCADALKFAGNPPIATEISGQRNLESCTDNRYEVLRNEGLETFDHSLPLTDLADSLNTR